MENVNDDFIGHPKSDYEDSPCQTKRLTGCGLTSEVAFGDVVTYLVD